MLKYTLCLFEESKDDKYESYRNGDLYDINKENNFNHARILLAYFFCSRQHDAAVKCLFE